MYQIVIDRSLCSGYGICADLAPHLFDIGDDGVAATRVGNTDNPDVIEVAAQCPMGAILVRSDERAAA